MASKTEIQFALRAINEASNVLKDVDRDVGNLGKTADDAGTKMDGFGSKAGGALGNIAQFAGGFIVAEGLMKMPGFLMDAAKAAADDEAATMRLNKTLENLLISTGDMGEVEFSELQNAMDGLIEKGQALAFSDDDVRDSMQTLIASTGDYGEAAKRHAAALDLARGAGIPLEKASLMLGKINEENVEVFKRLGITLGENATEADALAAVQEKFGGQADAYAKSTAGQFEIANLKMGEAKETIGTALLPAMSAIADVLATKVMPAVERFATFIAEEVAPRVQAGIDMIAPKFASLAEMVAPHLERFGAMAKEKFAAFQQYYESDLKPAFDNIVSAIEATVGIIKEHWDKIGPIFEANAKIALAIIDFFAATVVNLLQIVIDLISGDWDGAWKNFQDIIRAAKEAGMEILNAFVDAVGALWIIAKEAAQKLGKAIWDGITGAIEGITGWIFDIGDRMMDGLKDGIMAGLNRVKGAIIGAIDPRNWDIPGLSPLLDAYQHAGQLAGDQFASGVGGQIAAGYGQYVVPSVEAMAKGAAALAGIKVSGSALTGAYVPNGNGLLPGQDPFFDANYKHEDTIPFGKFDGSGYFFTAAEAEHLGVNAGGAAGLTAYHANNQVLFGNDPNGWSPGDYLLNNEIKKMAGGGGGGGGNIRPTLGGRGGMGATVVNLHFHGFVGDVYELRRQLERAGVMVGAA